MLTRCTPLLAALAAAVALAVRARSGSDDRTQVHSSDIGQFRAIAGTVAHRLPAQSGGVVRKLGR